jgi:signal transduction histidine kinase
MITDVMLFARPPEMVREPVDLRRLVETVLEEVGGTAAQQQTELEPALPDEPLTATGDREHLAAMLKALCVNALEALGHGGHVRVEGRRAGEDHADQVQLIVRDDGPGIPDDIREHLFDPFFSGREAGRGLGFGLSKSWRIATQHGGRIDVVSGPAGQGAVFTVTLPAGQADVEN